MIIITDIHNCYEELVELLDKCGFMTNKDGKLRGHPRNEKLVIGGDCIDRGPMPIETLDWMMDAVRNNHAIIVKGGHEDELRKIIERHPDGKWDASRSHHSRKPTLDALAEKSPEYIASVHSMISSLPSSYNLNRVSNEPTVVHAAWSKAGNETMLMHGSYRGWSVDEKWKYKIPGGMVVVSGHRNMREIKVVHSKDGGVSYAMDTGCSYGNKLTALHFEGRLFSEMHTVKAKRAYYPLHDSKWWD